MTVKEKVRPEVEAPKVEPAEPTRRWPKPAVWAAAIGAMLVVLAVGVALVLWITDGGAEEAAPTSIGQEFMERLVNEGYLPAAALEPVQIDETTVLNDLVNRGLVPSAAIQPVEAEAALLARLVNQGLLPSEVLESATPSLWSAEDLATLEAVRRGFIPEETIEEMLLMKKLINEGYVPAGSG